MSAVIPLCRSHGRKAAIDVYQLLDTYLTPRPTHLFSFPKFALDPWHEYLHKERREIKGRVAYFCSLCYLKFAVNQTAG